jgi:hypothetical protein
MPCLLTKLKTKSTITELDKSALYEAKQKTSSNGRAPERPFLVMQVQFLSVFTFLNNQVHYNKNQL